MTLTQWVQDPIILAMTNHFLRVRRRLQIPQYGKNMLETRCPWVAGGLTSTLQIHIEHKKSGLSPDGSFQPSKKVFVFGAWSMFLLKVFVVFEAGPVFSKNDDFLWVPWLMLASKKVFVFGAGSMANVVSSKNDDFCGFHG